MKTNAARLLDGLGIGYELREYSIGGDDFTAEDVARKIGFPPAQVFKTLVVRGDRLGVCLAVVPGDAELDLKALAQVSGDRKVETVPLKQVQPLTGYVRGGVTALACKKEYPVYLDLSAEAFGTISVSAGVRGAQIRVAPGGLHPGDGRAPRCDFAPETRAGRLTTRPSACMLAACVPYHCSSVAQW